MILCNLVLFFVLDRIIFPLYHCLLFWGDSAIIFHYFFSQHFINQFVFWTSVGLGFSVSVRRAGVGWKKGFHFSSCFMVVKLVLETVLCMRTFAVEVWIAESSFHKAKFLAPKFINFLVKLRQVAAKADSSLKYEGYRGRVEQNTG